MLDSVARADRQRRSHAQCTHLRGVLIFFAMMFDMFDGQVARLAKVTSDFGAQLDSLCDVVSFGVAPGILMVKMCPQFAQVHREASWIIAALYACCAAMRLARFNVETDEEDDHMSFEGLPSPAAASVIASFAMFSYTIRNETNFSNFEGFDWWLQRLMPLAALVIARRMVSRDDQRRRRHQPLQPPIETLEVQRSLFHCELCTRTSQSWRSRTPRPARRNPRFHVIIFLVRFHIEAGPPPCGPTGVHAPR